MFLVINTAVPNTSVKLNFSYLRLTVRLRASGDNNPRCSIVYAAPGNRSCDVRRRRDTLSTDTVIRYNPAGITGVADRTAGADPEMSVITARR